MCREGEVRSSELETGLSSSKDRKALEVTSPSTPYKTWDICCALKGKDENRIRNRFQFPSSVKVKIRNDDDRVSILTLMRCASTRPTSSMVFAFPSSHFLGSFLAI